MGSMRSYESHRVLWGIWGAVRPVGHYRLLRGGLWGPWCTMGSTGLYGVYGALWGPWGSMGPGCTCALWGAAPPRPLRRLGRQEAHEGLPHLQQHILGFDVRVDDLTLGVQVVQALQHLGGGGKLKGGAPH